MTSENLYLAHHGIKGMKWGVRRYQNEDGTLTPEGKFRYGSGSLPSKQEQKRFIKENKDGSYTIPKGYKFYRVGEEKLRVTTQGHVYVSDASTDDVYRYMRGLGPSLSARLLKTAHYNVQTITADKPLKLASEKQVTDITLNFLKKNPELIKTFSKSIYSSVVSYEDDIDLTTVKQAKSDPVLAKKIAYGTSTLLADSNFKNISKPLYSEFKKHGYDVIPDLHDIYSGTSTTPMIVLNPDKISMKTSTVITKDVYKKGKKIVKELGDLPIDEVIKTW